MVRECENGIEKTGHSRPFSPVGHLRNYIARSQNTLEADYDLRVVMPRIPSEMQTQSATDDRSPLGKRSAVRLPEIMVEERRSNVTYDLSVFGISRGREVVLIESK